MKSFTKWFLLLLGPPPYLTVLSFNKSASVQLSYLLAHFSSEHQRTPSRRGPFFLVRHPMNPPAQIAGKRSPCFHSFAELAPYQPTTSHLSPVLFLFFRTFPGKALNALSVRFSYLEHLFLNATPRGFFWLAGSWTYSEPPLAAFFPPLATALPSNPHS